ncbi:MAG: agmatinase family protein [Parvibaculales bacterium]
MTSNNLLNQFLGEELTEKENRPDTARFQVIPCGLEKTVSYGTGTAQGPAAMIAASHQLERLFEGMEPASEGIYTHSPVDCSAPIEQVMKDLRRLTADIAARNQIPVTLGGEHSLSFGAVMGVVDALQKPVGLVHVDAHADFRDAYQGHKHSHASVMNLLAKEGLPMASFGVRALSREEEDARRAHGVITHDAAALVRNNIACVELPADFPENVYVTFDLDGLDPSVLPATGTPVPGGLGYYQALDLVRTSLAGRHCVGIDVVELAPASGQTYSDFTAAQICYALMGYAVF